MKKFLKSFNTFEICYLILSYVIMIPLAIVFKSDLITALTAVLGANTVILGSKGNVYCCFLGFISCGLYIVSSFFQAYYGEMIIYLFLMFPLYIKAFIEWFSHRDKNDKTLIEINKNISKKLWTLLIFSALIITFLIYFLLKALHTNNLIVSTISFTTSLTAMVLMIYRTKFTFIFFLINDFVLCTLWFTPLLSGDIYLIPLAVSFLFYMASDIYGIINWSRLYKTQNKYDIIG